MDSNAVHHRSFADALFDRRARSPQPGFEQFLGSWHLRWTGFDPDGAERTAIGELHFGLILGGRAVQDVWIVPGPGQPGSEERPHAFHGTTVRFYDDAIGAWRSTWMDTVNGRVRKFVGRLDVGVMTLISMDGEPLLRWSFHDVTPTSFTWKGEYSTDEGRTWHLEEQMIATRSEPHANESALSDLNGAETDRGPQSA